MCKAADRSMHEQTVGHPAYIGLKLLDIDHRITLLGSWRSVDQKVSSTAVSAARRHHLLLRNCLLSTTLFFATLPTNLRRSTRCVDGYEN